MKSPALLTGLCAEFPRRVHISLHWLDGHLHFCERLWSQKFVVLSMLALSACSTQAPVVVTERINVPTFIPYPVTLVQPVQVTLQPGITYGEALGRLNAGLQMCNSQLTAIGVLTPPKPPINPQDKPY